MDRDIQRGVIKSMQTKQQRLSILVLVQTLIILTLSLGFLLFDGEKSAYSVLLGGAVCIVPHLFFIKRMQAKISPRNRESFLRALYLNEIMKLVLVVGLVILSTETIKLAMIPYILGILVAQISIFLGSILFVMRLQTAEKVRVK